MANITLLPSAKVPLIYDGELTMTTEWYRFFWNIYGFTGTGVVPVNKGGTGLDTIGNHQLIIGNTNNVFEPASLSSTSIAITYPAGFVNLELGTSGVTPGTYGSASQVGVFTVNAYGVLTAASNTSIGIDASQIINGTLLAIRGGTGQSTYAIGDMLYATGTTALSKLAVGASTYLLTSSGTAPQWTNPSSVIIGTATNLAGGLANQIPYQTGPGATTFMVAPTTANTYLEWSGTAFQWSNNPLGTVTSVSVVSANGFAGTVATATTTPAITLTTTITGLLKGNGTAISAATSGTDYAPATSGTSILYGNGAGGFSNVTIGTGVSFVGGTLSATGSGGTVTSVTGTSPVVSSGGTTPAISLATAYGDTLNPYASKTANYFLAAPNGSAGVPTFRAMVAADVPALAYVTSVSGTGTVNGITLTGTVTSSGSLTLGGTLSGIGNSQLTNSTISGVALGGNLFNLTAGTGVSFSAGTTYNGSAAITINATGTGGTVTSVAALTLGTTGTDLSSTVANSTTTPVITLNVPTASAANRGALSAADWTTFNSKQAALVSGTNIKTVGGVSLLGSGDVGTIGTAYGGTGLTSFTSGGVVYASSTSVLATGSALVFNGTSLGVGSTAGLGGGKISTLVDLTAANGLVVRDSAITYGNTNNFVLLQNSAGATAGALTHPAVTSLGVWGNSDIRFLYGASATEGMRLDSSGTVQIGTTTSRGSLTVYPNNSTGASSYLHGITPAFSGNSYPAIGWNLKATSTVETYTAITTDSSSWVQFYGDVMRFYNAPSVTAGNNYVGVERMRIHASGGLSLGNTTDPGAANLSVTGTISTGGGVGVGISAITNSLSKSIDILGGAGLWGYNNNCYLSANMYYNGGYLYKASTFASMYRQSAGAHEFYTAPSGTANAAITFTQAMTLDASGNLGVGVTNPESRLDLGNGALRFKASLGGTGNYGNIVAHNTLANTNPATNIRFIRDVSSAGNDGAICFDTVNAERMRINSSGQVLVGTTSATGSTTNTAPVVAGLFRSFSGSVSAASDTATTLFTASTGIGVYIVNIWVNVDIVGYSETAIVSTQGGTSVRVDIIANGSTVTISNSGYAIQGAQASGSTQTISYSVTRLV